MEQSLILLTNEMIILPRQARDTHQEKVFENGVFFPQVNLWLSDGTPVFMTPRYLHYACEIPYYPCDRTDPEITIAQRVVRALGRGSASEEAVGAVAAGAAGAGGGEEGGWSSPSLEEEEEEEDTTPRFAMVYGLVSGLRSSSIFDVIRKVEALLPEDVEVVTTDEFVALARAAAPPHK